MLKAAQFLKEAGVYYLASAEGDQPRVRPFGTVHIFDGKIYIQTNKNKPVSHQLQDNAKAEICAFHNGEWLRIACELIRDERIEAKQSMLEAYPDLQKMYTAEDANIEVLYLRNAVCTLSSFTHEPEVWSF